MVIVCQVPGSATEGGMTDSPDQVCHVSIHCPLQAPTYTAHNNRHAPLATTVTAHHRPQTVTAHHRSGLACPELPRLKPIPITTRCSGSAQV